MSKSPLRPVNVIYDVTTDRYLAGTQFQVMSPENVARLHPGAQIINYVDGQAFDPAAVVKAIEEKNTPVENTTEPAPESEQDAEASPKRTRGK